MRIQKTPTGIKLWLSKRDTYNWAHRPGAAWPCSELSGKSLFAEWSHGDLVDVAINGRGGDCDWNEFEAITNDFLVQSRLSVDILNKRVQ